MKSKILLYSAILISIASTTTSSSLVKADNNAIYKESSSSTQNQEQARRQSKPLQPHPAPPHQNQAPILFHQDSNNNKMPPSHPPTTSASTAAAADDDTPIISDVIGKVRTINIFAGFTRDISDVSLRLDSQTQNTTVLAPLNSALQAMSRKPWEDPPSSSGSQEKVQFIGQDGQERAQENLARFVESHIVPVCPWREGEKVETLAEEGKGRGREIWWEREEDGTTVIKPMGVRVDGVAEKVANGEVWVVKGVLTR